MRVYLDHNATTPLHPAALEAMVPYLKDDFGNPSSPHSWGQKARADLETARATVAETAVESDTSTTATSQAAPSLAAITR